MRIRLRDVAALAEVSEATVSRVMNNKSGVADATRRKVVRVLGELGYEPTALQTSPRAGLIGLIVPELDNPVFPAFAQAIESRLLPSGYVSVLCCASRAGATEEDYIETLLARNVAGMIIVSGRHADVGGDHSLYDPLVADGVPLVFVNGHVDGTPVPSVSCDDAAAARTGFEHLWSLGHRRIGFLTGPTYYVPVVRKVDGFAEAFARHHQSENGLDRHVAETMFTLEGGFAGARQLLDEGITGIVAASDLMALGAIRAVRESGRSVPDDVSVVGFDDTPLMRFTDPPLTTVRQPVQEIADQATTLLLAEISGRSSAGREILVSGELIARSSTAAAATSNSVTAASA